MLDNKVALIGYSGHGQVIADVAIENGLDILGYLDKKVIRNNPFNLNYLGNEEDGTFEGWTSISNFLIGIGDNYTREKVFQVIKARGKIVQTLVSKTAVISKQSVVEEGTFVNNSVTVNSGSKIGMNVILNTGCIVEHGCIIENSVHIAPGAVLSGNVVIGERSFVGANAVIKQGVVIGKDVIVGAGTVILRDVHDNKTVVGNPGRNI